jgi:hypothetical protein
MESRVGSVKLCRNLRRSIEELCMNSTQSAVNTLLDILPTLKFGMGQCNHIFSSQ